jgi:hypothetical protein
METSAERKELTNGGVSDLSNRVRQRVEEEKLDAST